MDDPANYPVLVHCYAGIHRTGTMCAVFRMDYQGWTNDEAMNEMRTFGYSMLDDHEDILSYLTRYHPPRDRKKIRTVYVPTPQNVSWMQNFESDLRAAVLKELNSRAGAPRVASDRKQADSELVMKIVNSTKSTVLANQRGEHHEDAAAIQVEVVWRDLRPELLGGPVAPPPAPIPYLVALTAEPDGSNNVANVMDAQSRPPDRQHDGSLALIGV